MTNETAAEEAVYPKLTSDGFFFDNNINETIGIESQTYENDKEVRRVKIYKGKQVAIIRQLTGLEMEKDVLRLCKDDKTNYNFALISIATKIDGEGKPMEFYMEMLGKDYQNLVAANSQINF